MSKDGQGTKCSRTIAENHSRLSRVHERYRQTDDRQTDGRATAYSERELQFTCANNQLPTWKAHQTHGSTEFCRFNLL